MRMSLGYVTACLVRYKLDVKVLCKPMGKIIKKNILWWELPYGEPWLKSKEY